MASVKSCEEQIRSVLRNRGGMVLLGSIKPALQKDYGIVLLGENKKTIASVPGVVLHQRSATEWEVRLASDSAGTTSLSVGITAATTVGNKKNKKHKKPVVTTSTGVAKKIVKPGSADVETVRKRIRDLVEKKGCIWLAFLKSEYEDEYGEALEFGGKAKPFIEKVEGVRMDEALPGSWKLTRTYESKGQDSPATSSSNGTATRSTPTPTSTSASASSSASAETVKEFLHVKLSLGEGEAHRRFMIPIPPKYSDLAKAVKVVTSPCDVSGLSYTDDYGDEVRIGSQMEIECAYAVLMRSASENGGSGPTITPVLHRRGRTSVEHRERLYAGGL
ncbi:hypothetical protein Pelo_5032 [Pelomyxa schiedti]|nr:hypothetical protein Pelo_5032 [Pelomyxa schiedti]